VQTSISPEVLKNCENNFHLAAVAHFYDEHHKLLIFDLTQESVVSDPISPEFTQITL